MRNRMRLIVLCSISAFLLSWGATVRPAAFAASPSAQPTSFKFRTPLFAALSYGQFYAAQELYWPNLNLEGTALPGKGSAAAAQSVAAGSEQMGYADTVSLMNSIQQGMPLKMIAIIARRDPTGIIFMKDSGIKDLKDLVGKRVATYPGTAMGVLLRTALRLNGIDERKLQIVNATPGAEIPLLIEHKIDAVVNFKGAADTRLRCKGYEASSIPLSSFGLEFYGQAVFVNTKWADQVGDDVVARALLGIIQGSTLLKRDSEQAFKILQKLNPQVQLDRFAELGTQQTFIRWSWYPESPVSTKQGFGWIDDAEMTKSQKVLVDSGLLQKESDIGAYYTNKYLKDPRVHQAAMELVHTSWPEAPDDVRKKCGL